MKVEYEVLESNVPFSESIIWKINRDYYQQAGLTAWSGGDVPHSMTSCAFVGKTYAALILGFLKDIVSNGEWIKGEKVYIIELGSGHGRLAFHILRQLDHMIGMEKIELPEYCIVVTDIVESNLDFFQSHPQFAEYISSGKLDVAYFDAVSSEEISLRKSGVVISKEKLSHAILAIANYFFDSLPTDLYRIHGNQINSCNLTVYSELDPQKATAKELLGNIHTDLYNVTDEITEQSPLISKLLGKYSTDLNDTYLLVPRLGIDCILTLKQFSQKGLMLLSMDKGFLLMKDLEKQPPPEMVGHGSFSLYVNFHALSNYCEMSGGKSLFSSFSDFSLKMACLLFLPEPDRFQETLIAYEHHVNDFGPDDYAGMKKAILRNGKNLSLRELIAALRMSYYDSTLFLQLLPHLKVHVQRLSVKERQRLGETLCKVGINYFAINESVDVAYEVGGLLYDLGFYEEALSFFENANRFSGVLADLYYNKILCLYQLRRDEAFRSMLGEAKLAFPGYVRFGELERLDLGAE